MKNKYLVGIFVLLLFSVYACQKPVEQSTTKFPALDVDKEKVVEKIAVAEPKEPTLKIISPKEGELIKGSKVTIELKAENFPDDVILPSPDRIVTDPATGLDYVLGEIIIGFVNGTDLATATTIIQSIGGFVIGADPSLNQYQVIVGNKTIAELRQIIGMLAQNPNVEYAVPNHASITTEQVKEGEGHFHVWLDSDKKVTADNIVTFENVVSGKHNIVAELVKSDHSSLSPKVTQSITINVESDYVPKAEAPQQDASEFTVEADDNGFYPSTLKAKIGDKVRINFKFRDNSIYFAGLDIKGPFPDIKYKLKSEQPITAEFTMKEETKITSWWPASGVKKATLTVEVAK